MLKHAHNCDNVIMLLKLIHNIAKTETDNCDSQNNDSIWIRMYSK